jgi:KUP system potassium uptake protein
VTADGAQRVTSVRLLAALGVVFGDIGTSPLYALRECFLNSHHPLAVTEANVLGVLSLITWALILVISIEYMAVLMRADNRGEGGILALTALIGRKVGQGGAYPKLAIALGVLGATLMFADSMITPAISVLSALEGLAFANARLRPLVVPLALLVITSLYMIQHHGTARIGRVFGPVMLVWFATLAVSGAVSVAGNPGVLAAINPVHALRFFLDNGLLGFFVMGAVFLVVTGGEALYADMGHFGPQPIRHAWFGVVLPALVLNYYGQGALLLRDEQHVHQLFFALMPAVAVPVVVVLAACATVIASQAVISGAFTIARAIIQLGYSPRLAIRSTSADSAGQIYVPVVNWLFLLGTAGLVLGFRNSSNLAAAYGVAVATTMLATTVLLLAYAHVTTGFSKRVVLLCGLPFLCIDVTFFSANLVKVPAGGWLPLLFALVLCLLIAAWRTGRNELSVRRNAERMPEDLFMTSIGIEPPVRVPGVAIYLSAATRGIPRALLHNLKHNKVLHEHVLLVTVETQRTPMVAPDQRGTRLALEHGIWRVKMAYGFMEQPDLPLDLPWVLGDSPTLDAMNTTYFLGHETVRVNADAPLVQRVRRHLFAAMLRDETSAADYFGLPPNQVVEIGAQVVL